MACAPGNLPSTSRAASTMKRGMSATGTEMSCCGRRAARRAPPPRWNRGSARRLRPAPRWRAITASSTRPRSSAARASARAASAGGSSSALDAVASTSTCQACSSVERRARSRNMLQDQRERVAGDDLEPLDRIGLALRACAARRAPTADRASPSQATARAVIAGTSRKARRGDDARASLRSRPATGRGCSRDCPS